MNIVTREGIGVFSVGAHLRWLPARNLGFRLTGSHIFADASQVAPPAPSSRMSNIDSGFTPTALGSPVGERSAYRGHHDRAVTHG